MGHGWVYKTQEWKSLRQRVLREESRCYLCGITVDKSTRDIRLRPSVDHVVPLDSGGPAFERSNARLTHAACNSSKGNRPSADKIIKTSGSW